MPSESEWLVAETLISRDATTLKFHASAACCFAVAMCRTRVVVLIDINSAQCAGRYLQTVCSEGCKTQCRWSLHTWWLIPGQRARQNNGISLDNQTDVRHRSPTQTVICPERKRNPAIISVLSASNCTVVITFIFARLLHCCSLHIIESYRANMQK